MSIPTTDTVVIIVPSPLDRYPLPRIDDIFRDMQGAKKFNKLDLRQGYHQIPLAEKDKAWGYLDSPLQPIGWHLESTLKRTVHTLKQGLRRCLLDGG